MSDQSSNTSNELDFDHPFNHASDMISTEGLQPEKEQLLFINGAFIPSKEGRHYPVINPADEEVLSNIATASKGDVNEAIKSAGKAHKTHWSKLSGKERGKYLYRIAGLLQQKAKELAVTETLNTGKPIRESLEQDIPLTIDLFFYYAGWADKLKYAFPGRSVASRGVVGAITSRDFPLQEAARRVAPALAAGNTVVLKPAESTPLSTLLLGRVFQEAELPPGVVTIVTGPESLGSHIAAHPEVHFCSFSESSSASEEIQKLAIETGKPYHKEKGRRGIQLLFEDAPIHQAVEGILHGIFYHRGALSGTASHLLIQESIYEKAVHLIKLHMATLKTGNPLDKNVDLGPLPSRSLLEQIEAALDECKKEGSSIYRKPASLPEKGFWCSPALIEQPSQTNRFITKGIPGPVLTVDSFRTPSEAVSMANKSAATATAGIWTEKNSRALGFASDLKAKMIWSNTFFQFDPSASFGSTMQSGVFSGAEILGLIPYLEVKT